MPRHSYVLPRSDPRPARSVFKNNRWLPAKIRYAVLDGNDAQPFALRRLTTGATLLYVSWITCARAPAAFRL